MKQPTTAIKVKLLAKTWELLVFSLTSFAQCLSFSFYCSYMSTIYPVRSFLSRRFFVKVVAALWIVLGLADMRTGVAVYLIFFLFCTFTNITVKNHPNLSSF